MLVAIITVLPLPKPSGQGWRMPCSRRRLLRKSRRSRCPKKLNSRLVLFTVTLHVPHALFSQCLIENRFWSKHFFTQVWFDFFMVTSRVPHVSVFVWKKVPDWNICPLQSGLIFHCYFRVTLQVPLTLQYLQSLIENGFYLKHSPTVQPNSGQSIMCSLKIVGHGVAVHQIESQ